jgi:small conductance mechanosensitive channel
LLDVALILLAAWILSRLSRWVLGRAMSRPNRKLPLDDRKTDTILSVAAYVVRVVIWFTAVVTILYRLGLSGTVGSLLATAGIGGIALGLGAQSLVKDYVGGFFLILDNRLSVGDFVRWAA